MAHTSRKAAMGSGIPLPAIASMTEVNLVIFTGTAITKTAARQIRPITSTDFRKSG